MNSEPDLILNPYSLKQLQIYIDSPSFGLLVSGPTGSGKTSVINWVAAMLLGIDTANVNTHPYVLKLPHDAKTGNISIDSVHLIDPFFGKAVLKSNQRQISRLVIIDDAENLSLPAQNALLKNLEEPPIGSTFLMSSAQPSLLLDTVKSRLLKIRLASVSKNMLKNHLIATGCTEASAMQAIALSGAIPGLAIAVANNQTEHPMLVAADAAKKLLSSKQDQKLKLVSWLAKDTRLSGDVLSVLQQMARLSLENSVGEQARRWQNVLNYAYSAEERLETNANLRLTMTNLALHI